MPAWIHNRAKHLLAKNPSMAKDTAFAIATQQSHKTGKTPKDYGTSEGKREAKEKYDKPKKEYKKTANPGDLDTPKLAQWMHGFLDELKKLAGVDEMRMNPKPHLKPASAAPPNPAFKVKQGFATSSYSGPLGSPRFKQTSMIPPFSAPPIKTSGPPSMAASLLRKRQSVGKPKTTNAPGPSIAQISKPKGYGKPMPGATKSF